MSLIENSTILLGVFLVGVIIGIVVGVPSGQFSESMKCHPETNPSNVSGVVVNQFQQGSYWYFDLSDNGTIQTVYTSDPVLSHHIVNGTFYKFSLSSNSFPGDSAYGVHRIDKQVIP